MTAPDTPTADQAAAAVGVRPILAPPPGVAVLACRCGQVLSLPDMQRRPTTSATSGPTVAPIRCRRCAATGRTT